MTWRITPIPLYRFLTPGPELLFQHRFGDMIELAIHAFLLEGPATVLVDTGLPAEFDDLTKAMRARKGPSAGFTSLGPSLVERLRERDIAPDAIIVTSFGPYAVGGLTGFPKIPIYASTRGLEDLTSPEQPGFSHPLPAAIRAELNRAIPVADESLVFPGVTMIESASHHPASSTIIIDTAEGVVAIADPVFSRANLVEGVALGAAEDARGWYREVRGLADRVDAVIPIHDLEPRPVARGAWHWIFGSGARSSWKRE